ncbi:hypothetical protein M1555_05410 [Patescibacteria group bacterium]|nr:hypothetical protein [Patescibacteria group bacterium]
MNTAVITIKTDPAVKLKARKVARELGFSLSGVINSYLRNLIRTKSVHLSLHEEPTPYLLKTLRESEEDRKAGRYMHFDTSGEELAFLDKMIANGRKQKSAKH